MTHTPSAARPSLSPSATCRPLAPDRVPPSRRGAADVDPRLLAQAMALTGARDERALIELALRALLPAAGAPERRSGDHAAWLG